MKNKKTDGNRSLVLDILLEAEKSRQFGSELVKQTLNKYDYLEGRDKAFIKRLGEGCIERMISLDFLLDQYLSSRPMAKQKPLIRVALRMGAYQILWMDHVPDHSACNETVKLLEERHFGQLKGFVNGVLRSIVRDKESGKLPFPKWEEISVPTEPGASFLQEDLTKLSVLSSVPELILNCLQADYGCETCFRLAKEQLQVRPVHIRVSSRVTGEALSDLRESWKREGYDLLPHPEVPGCYLMGGASGEEADPELLQRKKTDPEENGTVRGTAEGPERLPGFAEGLCTVQNASSMLVALAAGIQPGDVVMDVCAAPGGKSMHAADLGGIVSAFDLSEEKVMRMEDNFRRMQLKECRAAVWDATVTDPDRVGKADVLLMDVPCSGFGILGRKNDIKYHVTKEELASLEQLQKQIVMASLPYCREGAKVIYSTCTMRKAENQDMVRWMLDTFPLEAVSLEEVLPVSLQNDESKAGMCQIFPEAGAYDGFFLAKFRVRKEINL